MDRRKRSNLAGGLILILLGVIFLVVQLAPGLGDWFRQNFGWPWIVVGAGAVIFILGLLVGVPDMAVPAAIVGGIGLLLYWQNATGNWASWAYAWALIPGFAGVGILLRGLLGQNPRQSFNEGLNAIVVSAVMFAIFSSFLGGRNLWGPYWPVLIILLGLWLLVRPLFRR